MDKGPFDAEGKTGLGGPFDEAKHLRGKGGEFKDEDLMAPSKDIGHGIPEPGKKRVVAVVPEVASIDPDMDSYWDGDKPYDLSRMYKGEMYQPINANLRGYGAENGAGVPSLRGLGRQYRFTDLVQQGVVGMDRVIAAHVTTKDTTVMRLVDERAVADLKVGDSFVDHAYVSTSRSPEVMRRLQESGGLAPGASKLAFVEIEVPAGTHAYEAGPGGPDRELTLDRGTTFEVRAERRDSDGRRVLTLAVTRDGVNSRPGPPAAGLAAAAAGLIAATPVDYRAQSSGRVVHPIVPAEKLATPVSPEDVAAGAPEPGMVPAWQAERRAFQKAFPHVRVEGTAADGKITIETIEGKDALAALAKIREFAAAHGATVELPNHVEHAGYTYKNKSGKEATVKPHLQKKLAKLPAMVRPSSPASEVDPGKAVISGESAPVAVDLPTKVPLKNDALQALPDEHLQHLLKQTGLAKFQRTRLENERLRRTASDAKERGDSAGPRGAPTHAVALWDHAHGSSTYAYRVSPTEHYSADSARAEAAGNNRRDGMTKNKRKYWDSYEVK